MNLPILPKVKVFKMNEQVILQQILTLLEENGVQVRSEPLGGGGGGLCAVKGRHLFFVDTQSPTCETAALAADAAGKLVDIESIYLRPEVRLFINNHIQSEGQ